MCTRQDQESERGIQLPVLHTLSDHHICHYYYYYYMIYIAPISRIESEALASRHGVRPLGSHVKNGSFSSSMNCMSMDSIIEVFYHLNKMLIATKHIVDNNFVFQ